MKTLCLSLFVFIHSLSAINYEHFILEDLGEGEFALEDGSIWRVEVKNDKNLLSFMDAPLSFRADESWMSSEVKCCFVNTYNNQSLAASLVSPPKVYDGKSHWIAYLEPKKSILFLDNGVIFSLYDNDREYFNKWLADDFVIIGDYKSILSRDKQVLFNYRTKEFIFGEIQ